MGKNRSQRASRGCFLVFTMRFDVLTLFPDIFQGYVSQSLLKLAIQSGLVSVHTWNIRNWAKGKHQSVDDKPFGGGPGMVMKIEPIMRAFESHGFGTRASRPAGHKVVLTSPQGRRFTQDTARDWATLDHLVIDRKSTRLNSSH